MLFKILTLTHKTNSPLAQYKYFPKKYTKKQQTVLATKIRCKKDKEQ